MNVDILDLLWRTFDSPRLTLALLSALLLALVVGVVLPQMPEDLQTSSSEYAQWRSDIQARYLRWADLLQKLGLFAVYSSVWLRAPLALLAVNLVVCSAGPFETALRWTARVNEDPIGALRSASQSHSLLLPGIREALWPKVGSLLQDLGYSVRVIETERGTHLIAQRFSAARWARSFIHAGALLALAGFLIGGRLSWREYGITVVPGQQYQLQHAPSLAIRLDEFRAKGDVDGLTSSHEATITVLESGREVSTGVVLPGTPLRYRWISIWQLRQGPLIHLRATDDQGDPVSLQALAASGQIMDEVTLQFDQDEREGYVAVPERDLVLRLVIQPSPSDQSEYTGEVLVEAYRGGSTEVVSRHTISDSGTLEIEGDSYHTTWGDYAVLGVGRDLAVLPVALGAAILLSGFLTVLLFRHRYVWATVKEKQNVTLIEVFNPGPEEGGQEADEFDRLISRVRETLGVP